MQANSGNIILIGMPGSGKSTCGVVAAKLLLKNFFDTDLLIQNREGQRLQQIIDEKGLDYFARAEEEAVLSLDIAGTVIATGGSVVYSPAAMEHLRRCACDALQTDDIIVEDIPDEERAKQADRDYEEQKDAFFRRNMAGAMGRCAAPAGTAVLAPGEIKKKIEAVLQQAAAPESWERRRLR